MEATETAQTETTETALRRDTAEDVPAGAGEQGYLSVSAFPAFDSMI